MGNIFIPRHGAIFVSDKEFQDPAPINLFDVKNRTNPPDGWSWLGSASKQSPFALEREASPDPMDFDGEQADLCHNPTFWRFSFSGLWGSRKVASIAFGGEKYDPTLGAWIVDSIHPTYKSVVVALEGSDGKTHGFYMRRAKMQSDGNFSSAADDFAQFNIEGFVLKPDVLTWGKLLVFEEII